MDDGSFPRDDREGGNEAPLDRGRLERGSGSGGGAHGGRPRDDHPTHGRRRPDLSHPRAPGRGRARRPVAGDEWSRSATADRATDPVLPVMIITGLATP